MTNRLAGIQILRALAAVMVVIFHASVFAYEPQHLPHGWATLNFGNIGVLLFFTISGYVIGLQAEETLARFALHRVLRIYPPYFVAVLLGSILLALAGANVGPINFNISMLLLPGGQVTNWSQVPYWTLVYEMFFYCLAFLLMSAGQRTYDIGLICWVALIILVGPWLPHPVPEIGWVLIYSPLNLFFIAGACVARANIGRLAPIVMLGGMVGLATWLFAFSYFYWVTLLVMCASMVQGAVMLSAIAGKYKILIPAIRLGDWSYGLYLLHLPPIVALAALPMFGANVFWRLVIMTSVGGAVGLAFGAAEHRVNFYYFRPLGNNLLALLTNTVPLPPSLPKRSADPENIRILAAAADDDA